VAYVQDGMDTSADAFDAPVQEMRKKIEEVAKMSRRLPKIQENLDAAQVHF
jgi:hypothetical protein